MPRHVLVDEIHLSLFVPREFGEPEVRAVRRILNGQAFRTRLYRAARMVVGRFSRLHRVRFTLSR